MAPALKEKRKHMEIISIGRQVYFRAPFGKDALKVVRELDPSGKFIDVMQTTLMRKNEGKRFYI